VRPAVTGSASRATPWHRALQVTVGILAWAAFAHLALAQFIDDAPPDWERVLAIIVFGALALGLAALLWVEWSRHAARRHPSKPAALRPVAFDHDAIGRPIVSELPSRLAPGETRIRIDEAGEKVYEPADDA
jgi:hypothetical protein